MDEKRRLQVFLVRHGEVAANRRFAFIGRRNEVLTSNGVRQARALAETFKNQSVDRILSSPLERSVQTWEPIAEAVQLVLEEDIRLIEQSFGKWDGLTGAEIAAQGADERHRLLTWEQDPSTAPPGGESLLSVQRRVVGLVEELVATNVNSVVLISHVSPIKALLCQVLGLSLEHVRRFFLDPASISIVDWGSPPVLRLFNSHTSLDWQRSRWLTGP